ncbi:hypothetical protein [Levilactobacillus bambusae]|uniref:Uncharacterized protein n=1 Tax=Levilactobacillus bambusae TaxID=2024736 RepID=A0A2V1N383_9LACO|nr:hypothetical protein [Levilactobacillus bambusae]PWG00490.1 hypothetical protein DCM90_06075 [Levilactobacillus bambusae]
MFQYTGVNWIDPMYPMVQSIFHTHYQVGTDQANFIQLGLISLVGLLILLLIVKIKFRISIGQPDQNR